MISLYTLNLFKALLIIKNCDCQYRAARLDKMKRLMDDVPTEQEAKNLKEYINEVINGRNEQRIHNEHATDAKGKSIVDVLRGTNVNTMYQNYASHAIITTNEAEIAKIIEHVKKEEKVIIETLEKMDNRDEMREYLLQKFCVHTLTSFRRTIASHSFKPHPKVVAERYQRTLFGLFSFICVPCYFLFVALFVFLFGVQIGPQQTYAWLLSALISLLQELLLVRTAFVWTKTIILPSAVKQDVQTVYTTLMKRTNFVMLRKYGLMKDANARIQHVSLIFYSLCVSAF